MSGHAVWVVTEHGDDCKKCEETKRALGRALADGCHVVSVPMPPGFVATAAEEIADWRKRGTSA